MAADVPLDRLRLVATSRADEAAFTALADIATITAKSADLQYRLIGGIMVSLHAERWRLGRRLYRLTRDADFGVPHAVILKTDILAELDKIGYKKVSGNRFERPLDTGTDAPNAAVIDVLVPAYTSRARDNVQVGELNTTEVRGLALALNRAAVQVTLEMGIRPTATTVPVNVLLPDEVSMLVLRAYAWRARMKATDAVDLWRALEIASEAGIELSEQGTDITRAGDIIREAFLAEGPAFEALAKTLGLSREAQTEMHTRLRALALKIARRG